MDTFKHDFFVNDAMYEDFVRYAEKAGTAPDKHAVNTSSGFIRLHIKALIARQRWQGSGYYPVLHEADPAVQKALEVLK